MKMPWIIKRKPATPAEEQIERIKALLFPPLKLQEEMQPETKRQQFDFSL